MRIGLFLIVFSIIAAASCGSADSPAPAGSTASAANTEGVTTIQWLDSARNYGDINEGQKLALSFRFKNTGSKPLVIESVKPTCGCTIAEYPKQPIAPGQEGEITGEFDSNGREGMQHKHMTVRSNAQGLSQDISFEVNVVARKQAGQDANTAN